MEFLFSYIPNFIKEIIFLNEVLNLSNKTFLTKFIFLIGAYYVLRISYGILKWFKHYFLTFEKNFKNEFGDGWVVITGASDGIGKEFAIEFSKRNHKVLLVARNEEKLKSVCSELEKIDGFRQCKYIVFDFNKNYNKADVDEMLNLFSPYLNDISILINNVGFSSRNLFSEIQYETIDNTINVNLKSAVFLTRSLLPYMNKKDRKSLIVNNGSGLGRLHLSLSSMYCGSKAFLEAFSNSISQEGYNIDVTYLETGRILTNMNKEIEFGKIDANTYCKHALSKIGNYSITQGHYWCSIEMYLITQSFFSPILLRIFNQKRKIRVEEENKQK